MGYRCPHAMGRIESQGNSVPALCSAMRAIPIAATIGIRADEYLRRFSKSHHVELGDALIAATVSIHNPRFGPGNRPHYPMNDVDFY